MFARFARSAGTRLIRNHHARSFGSAAGVEQPRGGALKWVAALGVLCGAAVGVAWMGRNDTPAFAGRRKHKVLRVVLTGGPCGGKSSALSAIQKEFEKKGVKVLAVPEVPTLLLNGGCVYPGTAPENKDKLLAFEANLIRMQLAAEDAFNGIGSSLDQDVVVVYDRGSMDVCAYVTQQVWEAVLGRLGTTNKALLDRYDLVVHLVTAADGAVKFYTLSNNTARSETPEQAIQLDNLVYTAWQSHPRHVRVDNSTDFKGKLAKVINEVDTALAGKA